MSLYNRRLFLGFCAIAALAACGFTPAYAPGGAGQALQNSIRADDPTDKPGFDLVERLEERLGPAKRPRYALSYTIKLNPVGVAITTSNAVTRYNLNGSVDWALTDLATNARLTGGRVDNFTSYSATGSTVAGLAAEEDASLRLMRILADQITTRLLATSAQWTKLTGGASGE
jgi:LPS-assembly lipoprotein